MMNPADIEERVQRAQTLFRMGYNCSQAVFAACADLYGITDKETAFRLSASFGGGIGRMHKTCGACCGMFMLEGLNSGSALPGDTNGKAHNYNRVQMLANEFRNKYGSITCARLLGLKDGSKAIRKEPCVDMVGEAVRIFLKHKN